MARIVNIASNDPDEASGGLSLDSSTYSMLVDDFVSPVFGSPIHSPLFSTVTDVINGTVLVGETEDMREWTSPILVTGSSASGVASSVAALYRAARRVSRFGGRVRWRPSGASYALTLNISKMAVVDLHSSLLEARGTNHVAQLSVAGDAYGLADPFEFTDTFSQDTFGTEGQFNDGGSDWTAYSTSSASISGGVLTTATTSGNFAYRNTGTGNSYGNLQVTVKAKISSLVANKNFGAGRLTSAGNGLVVRAYSDGAGAATLSLVQVDEGAVTSLGTTAITTMSADTWYWLRMRLEGNVLYAEFWATEPTPTGTPTHSTSTTLSTTNARKFGIGQLGEPCVWWNTQGSGTVAFDSFKVEPNVWRSATTPRTFPLGAGGGDADALLDMTVTTPNGASAAAIACAASAYRRPRKHNVIYNGSFEANANGWGFAAITGVQANTGTAFARDTAQFRTGVASGKLGATGASSGAGCNFTIYGDFRKGRSYVAVLWGYASASTTSMVSKLGVSGDVATSPARALTTAWRPWVVTWTPTADVTTAYLSFQTNAATATTCWIDDVMVYEMRDVKDVYSDSTDLDPVFEMEDDGDGTVTDNIGARAGTVNGNPTYGKLGPIPGLSETAMDLDGTGDYVSFAYDATLNPTVFSVEAWIMRDTDTGAAEQIIDGRASNKGFSLLVRSTDVMGLNLGDGAAYSNNDGVTTLSTGVWYHLVATYDGTNARLYLNGHLEAVTTDSYSVNTSGTTKIGSDGSTANLNGKVFRPRVYNRVLSDEEVMRRYAGALPAHGANGALPPVGIIDMASCDAATLGSAFAITANANFRSGSGLRASGSLSTNGTAEVLIDPSLYVQDDYSTNEAVIDILGRFEISSTQVSVYCLVELKPEDTSYGVTRTAFGNSYAAAGVPIASPSSGTWYRVHSLGRLVLPVDRANPKRYRLKVTMSNDSSSTGNVGIDHLALFPATRMATTQTGCANDSSYASFLGVTTQISKRVDYNLRGFVVNPASSYDMREVAAVGLRGNQLLCPPEDAEALVWFPHTVIDQDGATTETCGISTTATVKFARRTRHAVVRT